MKTEEEEASCLARAINNNILQVRVSDGMTVSAARPCDRFIKFLNPTATFESNWYGIHLEVL